MSIGETEQGLLDRLARLEARVARSEAALEILALKSRYGALADARYARQGPRTPAEIDAAADALAALFSEDAVWEAGGALGRCEGRAAIRERFREPTLHWAWHFFVKPEIRVEGDRAEGTWDVLALVTTKEGRAMWMIGVEHDAYARIDGRWLHASMRLDSRLMAPHDRGWAAPRTRA